MGEQARSRVGGGDDLDARRRRRTRDRSVRGWPRSPHQREPISDRARHGVLVREDRRRPRGHASSTRAEQARGSPCRQPAASRTRRESGVRVDRDTGPCTPNGPAGPRLEQYGADVLTEVAPGSVLGAGRRRRRCAVSDSSSRVDETGSMTSYGGQRRARRAPGRSTDGRSSARARASSPPAVPEDRGAVLSLLVAGDGASRPLRLRCTDGIRPAPSHIEHANVAGTAADPARVISSADVALRRGPARSGRRRLRGSDAVTGAPRHLARRPGTWDAIGVRHQQRRPYARTR